MTSGFNPERAVFFMPSGTGPCRFGQYNILHRLILNEIGLPDIPIYAPNQDASLYQDLGIIGKDFTLKAWKGLFAVDLLMKCLHETRPYERSAGESDGLYAEYLGNISKVMNGKNGGPNQFLKQMREDFSNVPKYSGRKPMVGMIGEIFVRQNAFSNEDIIKKVEELGGEVWLAPFEEWIYYINFTAARRAFLQWKRNLLSIEDFKKVLSLIISRSFQKKIDHDFSKQFDGYLKTLKEPTTTELLKKASPYLHHSFEGEAVLSLGKAVDYVALGASGIISAMPFGCMPGTIVSALLKGLRQDTGVPCLSAAYDGAEANCSDLHLEAFMHQVHEYSENKTPYE